MLSKKMQEAMNEQMNKELWSAYLYLSMAAYFDSKSLGGFANWMRIQAREEVMHAMKFYDHVIERGGRVNLFSIEAPPSKWSSPKKAFEETLEHEKKVTGFINDLVDLAQKEKDHASNNFLQWFVEEQVEEEATAGEILDSLKLIGNSKNALFTLDRELGQRTWVEPVDEGE